MVTPSFIRPLESADRSEFLQMSQIFYASDAVLHPVDESYHERAFDELLRSQDYLMGFALLHQGQIAGYALLNKTYSREAGGIVIWIEELYVKPAYRGQGLASQFFDWLEQNVPAARYRLEAEPDNARAIALYRRKGFSPLPYAQMVKDTI